MERQRVTFFYERWRALSAGMIETLHLSFILVIAIRYFGANNLIQGLLATTWAIGLFLSPFSVAMIRRLNWSPAKGAAFLVYSMSASFLVAGLGSFAPHSTNLLLFTIFILLGINCVTLTIPLLTEIYQQNYPAKKRGQLFAWSSMIKVGATALFAYFAGALLTVDINYTPYFLIVLSLAAFISACLLSRVPSCEVVPIVSKESSLNPFHALSFLRSDRAFLILSLSWMFIGFGNLMMLPLRVKLLAEEVYGHAYSIGMISLVVTVITPVTQLSLSFAWGKLFDKMNIFMLRILINVFFISSHGCFFLMDNFLGFIIGAILLGAAFSGGDIAWSLWVTKIAPKNHVADYMSVHTFLTGCRAFVAPLIAVLMASYVPLNQIAYMSIFLMTISIVVLLPEVWSIRNAERL
ncbi:MAG: MFS transporter [Verrucomicrobiota bacterium]